MRDFISARVSETRAIIANPGSTESQRDLARRVLAQHGGV